MSAVISVDCDLHRIHAWCGECGPVGQHMTDVDFVFKHVDRHELQGLDPLVIYEIASPVSGARETGNARLYQLTKWMLFNVHIATRLDQQLGSRTFHVAPSNVWTKGYNEEVRQKMAAVTSLYPGTKKKIGHDLRECQAMLWFHKHNPEKWIPLHDFMEKL